MERVLQLKVGSRESFADWSPDDDKFALQQILMVLVDQEYLTWRQKK